MVVALHKGIIEPFQLKRKSPRCSNFLNFNHVAGRCKAPPKCKNCAEQHKTQECPNTRKQDHTEASTVIKKQNQQDQ